MKKILVTGGSSFLGHHVVPALNAQATLRNPGSLTTSPRRTGHLKEPRFEILTPSSQELDLLDTKATKDYIWEHNPDTILHMAAKCGGIGANKDAPADFIHDNIKMSMNLFDAIKNVNGWIPGRMRHEPAVTHFYGLGSVCAYPKHCPVPFKEDDLWNGLPEETNNPYGQSKRIMLTMQEAFRDQYGLKGAHLIPVNMYGTHDHFNPRNSHVIPALIRKFVQARNSNDKSVEIWGDGTPTREFLYANDCASAICHTIVNRMDISVPINLGTGVDISIEELAELIRGLVGYNGELVFTGEVSVNGQPVRRLDVSRAKEILGFEAGTSLVEGLKETIQWFEKNPR